MLCVVLLLFNNSVSAQMRYALGFVMIAIFFVFVVYNTIIIIIFSVRVLWVFIRRVSVLCLRKKRREEAIVTTRKINILQKEIKQNKTTKEGFLLKDSEGNFVLFGTGYGGYGASFNYVKKKSVRVV